MLDGRTAIHEPDCATDGDRLTEVSRHLEAIDTKIENYAAKTGVPAERTCI